MQYFLLFLEGIITFVSPCMLPMLPIYLVYFAGGKNGDKTTRALINSMGFVLGFTVMFILLGAFAAAVGGFLKDYSHILNIVSGAIVVIFGLSYLNIISLKLGLLNSEQASPKVENLRFLSSFVFGVIFSISWTPCVGAFLGSALMQAGQQGDIIKGIVMLLFYSIGLGIPFVISAILIHRLKTVFDLVKKHYRVINIVSGLFLILIGIMMMTGTLGYFLSILSQ